MKKATQILLVALMAGGISSQAQAVTECVGNTITTDTTWSGDVELTAPCFVKSGATLTIDPGAVIRSHPRTAAVTPGVVAGTPGALIVTRDGYVNANGGPNNPIIFTTAAVDNDGDNVPDDLDNDGFLDAHPGWAVNPGVCDSNPANNTCVAEIPANALFYDDTPLTAPLAPLAADGTSNESLWGGLVILGNAPTNLGLSSGVGHGEGIIEGLTIPGFPVADATYGGGEFNDSSGEYSYISVRHGGDEIGAGNELNGISLGGVGAATVFHHIEVYCNFDDGIEHFGGSVNGSHLAVFFAGDDSLDVDQGYVGTNQNVFVIMPFFNQNSGSSFGSASGDRAGEWDGDDFLERGGDVNTRNDDLTASIDDTPWPLMNPAFYNVTVIGSTLESSPDFTPVSAASDNRGIYMRHGFAGEILNSIVVNTGSRAGFELDMGAGESTPGHDVADNVAPAADLIRIVSSTAEDGAALAAGAAAQAAANGDAAVPEEYNDSGTANVLPGGGFSGMVNEDVSFDPTGNAGGKLDASLKTATIDPRPSVPAEAAASGGVTTGPDASATYRGAFPASTSLWTDGWTALSQGGLL